MPNLVKKNYLRGLTSYSQIYNKEFHILSILLDLSPHFYSHDGEIWHDGVDLGLPHA